MNDPEVEAVNEPLPDYVDLANAIVALVEWYPLCGGARHGERPIFVSEDDRVIEKMAEPIRQALASGKIRGYFREGSEFIEIPEPLWKNDRAWKAARRGTPLLEITMETTKAMFRPLVKFGEISSVAFPDKHQPTVPLAAATEPGQHPRRPPQPTAPSTDAPVSAAGPRRPPYLDFMNRVAEDLHLDGRRIVAKVLRHQLEVRYTELGAALGPLSNAKLAAMATLLRYPEYEKGGRLPAPSAEGPETAPVPRRPPYLDFMKRVAEDLPRDGRRLLRSALREHLKEHWPPELGSPSNAKLAAMATLLGNPVHEKGGRLPANYRGLRAKR